MRISTLSMTQAFLANLGRQQSALSQTQLQITTGQRFTRPAEDPVAATRALELSRTIQETTQHVANADFARNRLALEEGVLIGVGDVLQRVRELAIKAANATETAESRTMIAAELRQRLDSLLQLANTQDGNGQYLFSGFSSQTQPFTRTAAGFQYNGDSGQRMLEIGPGRTIADGDSGARVFQMVRNGTGVFVVEQDPANTGSTVVGARALVDPAQYDGGRYRLVFTAPDAYEVIDAAAPVPPPPAPPPAPVATGAYTPGQAIVFRGVQLEVTGTPAAGDAYDVGPSRYQDVFTTVQNLVNTVAFGGGTESMRATFQNSMNRAIEDLDQALGNVLEVRAEVGGRMNALEAQQGANTDLAIELKQTLSGVRDLDYAEAITRLNQQMVALEAAQKGHVRMQGLSLFNYL